MCGFIVQIECNDQATVEDSDTLFERIKGDLQIRGPDAQNFIAKDNVFMAHARLSIIAIESGHQPMVTRDFERAVVFNGEIFNHSDLRSDFPSYPFKTTSDTELLLALENIQDPQSFLNNLRGMFSFAVVDFHKKRMLVARDRFGKKPLFVGKLNGKLFASSRINTIVDALPKSAVEVSKYGLGYFVDFGFIPAPFSIVEGVEKLLPGEWRVYDFSGEVCSKGFVESRTLPCEIEAQSPTHLSNKSFEGMMKSSLQTRLVAERPIGLLLSDGIDSSIIAKTLVDLKSKKLGKDIKAIILASGDEFDESKGAAKFAKSIGLDYEVVDMQSSQSNFDEALAIMDEPFADLSFFPTYFAFKALKNYATVALTGDGGDELFGGYPYRFQNRYFGNFFQLSTYYGPLRRLKLLKDLPHAVSKSSYLYRRLSTSGLFHSPFYKKYKHEIPSIKDRFEALKAARPDFNFDGEISLSQWHNSVSLVLSDRMLTKVDVCSMGAGVEARSPFLDEDLWNSIMQTDATNSDQVTGQCKTFLKNYIGPFKENAPKRGFTMDYSRFTQTGSKQNRMASKFLSDSQPAEVAERILESWLNRLR